MTLAAESRWFHIHLRLIVLVHDLHRLRSPLLVCYRDPLGMPSEPGRLCISPPDDNILQTVNVYEFVASDTIQRFTSTLFAVLHCSIGLSLGLGLSFGLGSETPA